MVGERIDSVGSLTPESVREGLVELCGHIEQLISVRLKQAGLHRDLSDVEREEAHLLERIRLYWIREKVKSLEGEQE